MIIIIGIPVISAIRLLTDKDNIKTWLKEGGLYSNFVDVVTDQAYKKIDEETVEKSTNLSRDDILSIVKDVLTEDWLTMQGEKIVDSVYSWLEGENARIDFQIDLSERKEILGNSIGTLLKAKLADIPACGAGVVPNPGDQFNPFEAECLPQDVDYEQEVDKAIDSMIADENFLADAQYDSKEINISSEVTNRVQQAYEVSENIALVFLIAVFVITLVLFIIVPGFKNGFIVSGFVLLMGGSLVIIETYFYNNKFEQFYDDKISTMSEQAREIFTDLIESPIKLVVSDVFAASSRLAIVFVVLGGILIFGGILLKLSKRRYYMREDDDEPVQPIYTPPTSSLPTTLPPQSQQINPSVPLGTAPLQPASGQQIPVGEDASQPARSINP